jgi:hypothetical protein
LAVLTAIAVTLSPLVTDLIASLLAARAPLTVTARFETREAGLRVSALPAPDLVLVGLFAGENDQVVHDFHHAFPQATVATFSHDGRRVGIHAPDAPETGLQDALPDELAAAVLSSVRGRRSGRAI